MSRMSNALVARHTAEFKHTPEQPGAAGSVLAIAKSALRELVKHRAVEKAARALLSDDTHTGDANCRSNDHDDCCVDEREKALQVTLDALGPVDHE